MSPEMSDGTYTLWDYELRTEKIDWKGTPGQKKDIFYFARKGTPIKKGAKRCGIPEGYFVGVNKRPPYLPFLTKKQENAYHGTPGAPS